MPLGPGLTGRMHPAHPRRDRRHQPITRDHQILHLGRTDRRRVRHPPSRQRPSRLPYPPHQHPRRGPAATLPTVRLVIATSISGPATRIPSVASVSRADPHAIPLITQTPVKRLADAAGQVTVTQVTVTQGGNMQGGRTRRPVVAVTSSPVAMAGVGLAGVGLGVEWVIQRREVVCGGPVAGPAGGTRYHRLPPLRAEHTPAQRTRLRVRSTEPRDICHPPPPPKRIRKPVRMFSHSRASRNSNSRHQEIARKAK